MEFKDKRSNVLFLVESQCLYKLYAVCREIDY